MIEALSLGLSELEQRILAGEVGRSAYSFCTLAEGTISTIKVQFWPQRKSEDSHNTSPAGRTKSPSICASVTVANMDVGAELTRTYSQRVTEVHMHKACGRQ